MAETLPDLQVWQEARRLRQMLYRLSRKVPAAEQGDLGSQLRRAAVSVTANIAEGFGRFSFKENVHFCRVSRGSLYECQDHLITCLDERCVDREEYAAIFTQSIVVAKLLNAYIRSIGPKETQGVSEEPTDYEAGDAIPDLPTDHDT